MIIDYTSEVYYIVGGFPCQTYKFSEITYDEWLEIVHEEWNHFQFELEDCPSQIIVQIDSSVYGAAVAAYNLAVNNGFGSWIARRVVE